MNYFQKAISLLSDQSFMESLSKEELLEKIRALEEENCKLRESQQTRVVKSGKDLVDSRDEHLDPSNGLTLNEYKRYGRQMIVPQFGSLKGQMKLKGSKALVVGAGGLGCPAILYLSAAGVGQLGIIDDDMVDISNLHRQVLHTTDSVGDLKCESAKRYVNKLNPHVVVKTYPERLHNHNAFDIFDEYDIILDCTDTPAVRYLINDVSVLLGKTIVSGSGLKSDGQLSVLNFENRGPCYRCFYPSPPSPGSVTSCSDGGVIGPAIGVMGVLMASECIKILTGYHNASEFKPFLSMYSGYPQQQLRVFKMRNKQKSCNVCGDTPTVTKEKIMSNEIDYNAFCGTVDYNIVDSKNRIEVTEFNEINDPDSLLIDVRPKEQFEITRLPRSVNIPWDSTLKKSDDIESLLPDNFDKRSNSVYVMCRYGNDSQLAARKLMELGCSNVKDIKGGLDKWSQVIDPSIPRY